MWLGVVGDARNLIEAMTADRGVRGQWAFYCGRSAEHYRDDDGKTISREQMLGNFKPVLNCGGIGDGGYGSFHFPERFLHRLVPCNTGDIVDLEVDAQEKIFSVTVNGVFQASSKVLDMPKRLAFFVQLDSKGDSVEFELRNFKLEKRRNLKDMRNDVRKVME